MTRHPRVLAIASAASGCAAAMIQHGVILAEDHVPAERGLPAAIPPMVGRLVAQAGQPDLVAAVVGPGSFTGIRAGLAVAHGVALGAGVELVGVTVAEAMAVALPALGERILWVAMHSRRNRVFLDRAGEVAAFALDAIPVTRGPVAVAGDAANEVAAVLAARGLDVMLASARRPLPRHVALVAMRRAAGELPELAAVPMYVDAPEARLPAGGLRPPPQ